MMVKNIVAQVSVFLFVLCALPFTVSAYEAVKVFDSQIEVAKEKTEDKIIGEAYLPNGSATMKMLGEKHGVEIQFSLLAAY